MSNHQFRHKHAGASHKGDWYVFWPAWAICAFLLLIAISAGVSMYRGNDRRKVTCQ